MVKLSAPIPSEVGPEEAISKQPTVLVTEAVESTGGQPTNEMPERIPLDRIDRQLALIVGAVSFALYLRTVAPDLLSGDSGEFQFAAWNLGLAHPTGYPFYLLLGWLWQHTLAFFGASPAWALNAFSAFTASIGVALIYLSMAQWTPLPTERRRLVGVYSAILLLGNITYWSQAVIAEVYALHVVFMLALLLATQALIRTPSTSKLLLLAALAGLALTHHALTLLWLPMLWLYWWMTIRQEKERKRLPVSSWVLAVVVALVPILLYAYIPLRSGPEASPWYHQRLGDGTLSLYQNNWASFWAFISGGSIGAGFRSVTEAWGQITQAGWLWSYHFGWVGLAMMAVGLFWLLRTRRYAILVPTLLYVIAQQLFNLFYDIGDILVYYIPLYIIGTCWAGFGMAGLVMGEWRMGKAAARPSIRSATLGVEGWLIAGALMLLALRALPTTSAQMDQSAATDARQQWESILAATPPADAIMVSNDRNEIVPLFYLQTVEERGVGMTGLFPAIAPEVRFGDIGATVETALAEGGDQRVYLIKPMPGLDVRFDLQPAAAPLVEVLGPITATPTVSVNQPYGPLQLFGYNFTPIGEGAELALYWQVNEPMQENYVATAQLLTQDDQKISQDDHAPGGDYYPTSLWKPGEEVVVRHTLPFTEALPEDARLLVGFYRASDQTPLAQPLIMTLNP